MARSAEEILRDYLGDNALTIVKLSAEVERLRGEIVTLDNDLRVLQDAEKARAVPGKPNGAVNADHPTTGPF